MRPAAAIYIFPFATIGVEKAAIWPSMTPPPKISAPVSPLYPRTVLPEVCQTTLSDMPSVVVTIGEGRGRATLSCIAASFVHGHGHE